MRKNPPIPANPNTLKWQGTITDTQGTPLYSIYQRHTFRPTFGCYWPEVGAILTHAGDVVRHDREWADLLKQVFAEGSDMMVHHHIRPAGVSAEWEISNDLREAIAR